MKRRDKDEPIEPLSEQAAEQPEQSGQTAGSHAVTRESAAEQVLPDEKEPAIEDKKPAEAAEEDIAKL